MALSHDEKEHLSEVKAIAANIFDYKELHKALEEQEGHSKRAVKELGKAFGGDMELLRDAAVDILTAKEETRTEKAAELVYYAYGLMGSRLASDCGLNTELRKILMEILADQVVPCLELIGKAMAMFHRALRETELGMVFVVVTKQVEECIKDTKDYVNRMTQKDWSPAKETDQAKAKFREATNHLAHVVGPLPEKVHKGLNDAKEAAEKVLAA